MVLCLALLELLRAVPRYRSGEVTSTRTSHDYLHDVSDLLRLQQRGLTGTKTAPAADAPKMAVTVSIRLSRYMSLPGHADRAGPASVARHQKPLTSRHNCAYVTVTSLEGERRSFAPLPRRGQQQVVHLGAHGSSYSLER